MKLRHPSHPSASESWVLVAITPTIDCALDQAALLSKRRIQLRECPAYCIALALIGKAIALVLILGTTRSRIYTIGRFKFLAQLCCVDVLDVTTDRVLHLHSVARILECNPLHSIIILADHKRRRRWNRTWCCAGIRSSRRRKS